VPEPALNGNGHGHSHPTPPVAPVAPVAPVRPMPVPVPSRPLDDDLDVPDFLK
jgi:hypothetical protein